MNKYSFLNQSSEIDMTQPPLAAPGTAPEQSTPALPLSVRIGRLRVRHLQLLDQIEKNGSLSAGAAALGVSQPGATNMLHEIEEAFGRTLLDRSHRGGRLNAAGINALSRMRVALGALVAATATLSAKEDLPLVRLGIVPLVGLEALREVVANLEADATLPRIALRLGSVGELLTMLVNGEVDCVVSSLDSEVAPQQIHQFRISHLWEERRVVVAAIDNPLVRRRKVTLEESLQHPWILMPARSTTRQAVERMFLTAGLPPPEARIETNSFHIGLNLAAGSRMLTVVPESAYRQCTDKVRKLQMSQEFQPSVMTFITLRDIPTTPYVDLLAERFGRYAKDVERRLDNSPATGAMCSRDGPRA